MNRHISGQALKVIESHFSASGVGISLVNAKPKDNPYRQVKDIRFCEAVNLARREPVLIDKNDLSCQGARLAFGLNDADEQMLIQGLMQKRGVSESVAIKLVASIPRYRLPFHYILLNGPDPQAVIFYFTPDKFMDFLRVFQKTGKTLDLSLSSVMALCGDVAVRTLNTWDIAVSFGCQDSREYGGIRQEEFVMALSAKKAAEIAALLQDTPALLEQAQAS
jgi:uncharacterized protein (DUF169 family)